MPIDAARVRSMRRHDGRRRHCLAALATASMLCCGIPAQALEAPDSPDRLVDVWLDLDVPVSRPSKVRQQQDAVGRRLREMGIAELARVQHVRNAIAVRSRRNQVPMLHRIPGVVRVRPATTRHPPRPDQGSPQS